VLIVHRRKSIPIWEISPIPMIQFADPPIQPEFWYPSHLNWLSSTEEPFTDSFLLSCYRFQFIFPVKSYSGKFSHCLKPLREWRLSFFLMVMKRRQLLELTFKGSVAASLIISSHLYSTTVQPTSKGYNPNPISVSTKVKTNITNEWTNEFIFLTFGFHPLNMTKFYNGMDDKKISAQKPRMWFFNGVGEFKK